MAASSLGDVGGAGKGQAACGDISHQGLEGTVQGGDGVLQTVHGGLQAVIAALGLQQGQLGDLPQFIAQLHFLQGTLGAFHGLLQGLQLKLGGEDGQIEGLRPGNGLGGGIVDLAGGVLQGFLVVLLLVLQIV